MKIEFWIHISKNWYTFPSSIYKVPVVLRKTSNSSLLAVSYTKWYNGAKRTIIYITENLLVKWYDRTIKCIIHEMQHVLQHSIYTTEQIDYIKDIFDIIKVECFPSWYSETNFWEYDAEIIWYWLGYIEKDLDMPLSKIWNKETQIVFDMLYKLHKNALYKYLNK